MNITRGKQQQAQKVVVYGPEGIGKTTFASQFPDPVFIDTEGSTANMDVARMDRPTSFTMLLQEIGYIKANPTLCKTLVIDTADWAEQLCTAEFCAKKQITGIEDIGYGKGYVYVSEDFGKMLNALEELKLLGINIVITAHAQMRKFEQPDELGAYDRWELKLQKKNAPLLKEWADIVLFANYETYVVNVDGQGAQKGKNKAQGGRRIMYTQHHPCWDAKNRHGLPEKIPMEYSQIAHCIPSSAVTNIQSKTQQNTTTVSSKQEPVKSNTTVQQPVNQGGADITKPTEAPQSNHKEANNGIPEKVMDLIKASPFAITEEDIMEVVYQKGYFPKGTKLLTCGNDFIEGWVIPFWDKITLMIRDNKLARGEFVPVGDSDEMPFN